MCCPPANTFLTVFVHRVQVILKSTIVRGLRSSRFYRDGTKDHFIDPYTRRLG